MNELYELTCKNKKTKMYITKEDIDYLEDQLQDYRNFISFVDQDLLDGILDEADESFSHKKTETNTKKYKKREGNVYYL